ncbi:MAG: M48 family metallopeptidase [Candidatus Micrarchaeota archaeon]|nr:M48 family metallopeptidase [Candidatus Micrarchaeota archaeon]
MSQKQQITRPHAPQLFNRNSWLRIPTLKEDAFKEQNSAQKTTIDIDETRPNISREIERMLKEANVEEVFFVKREDKRANAWITSMNIFLTSTLLEKTDDRQLLAVIAHELGHAYFGHQRKREAEKRGMLLELDERRLAIARLMQGNFFHKALAFWETLRMKCFGIRQKIILSRQKIEEECEADCFAVRMGYGKELAGMLELLWKQEGLLKRAFYSIFSKRSRLLQARIDKIKELVGQQESRAQE